MDGPIPVVNWLFLCKHHLVYGDGGEELAMASGIPRLAKIDTTPCVGWASGQVGRWEQKETVVYLCNSIARADTRV